MELNKYIDHTLLKADATEDQIVKICEEAIEFDFFAVCVNSCHVALTRDVRDRLNGKYAIASVIGFPLGAMSTESKVAETSDACENGATEIDMVINIGMLKDKRYDDCREDIAAVVREASKHGAHVKVIIETCYLTDDEKKTACLLSKEANAAFVKTSTGFGTGGATVDDVRLMRETVGPEMGVKASGGIRDLETALAMIDAGANRLGASAGIQIISEYNSK